MSEIEYGFYLRLVVDAENYEDAERKLGEALAAMDDVPAEIYVVSESDVVPVPDEQAIERAAKALYDLREHEGVRPPVSTWPPVDPEEADDYRLEARTVAAALEQPE